MASDTDVARHYFSLCSSLVEDGFYQDPNVVKVMRRLRGCLEGDGFPLSSSPTESIKEPAGGFVVRAFRVKGKGDIDKVSLVFSSIEGWKTRPVERGGSYYIIASNAPRLTKKRVDQALREYSVRS